MKTHGKCGRLLAILLVVCMIVSVLPTAVFAAEVTITYDGNGSDSGTVPSPATTDAEGKLTEAQLADGGLKKTGCVFTGWAIKKDDNTYEAVDKDTVFGAETTIYAQWKEVVVITFNGNENTGGTAPKAIQLDKGGNLTEAQLGAGDLVKTGFTFDGWATKDGTDYTKVTKDTPFNADTTLYAQWVDGGDSKPAEKVTVTFDANGGTAAADKALPAAVQIDKDGKLSGDTQTAAAAALEGLTKTGCTTEHWATRTGDKAPYTYTNVNLATDTFDKDTTLYARWTVTVTFDKNGATSGDITPVTIDEGTAIAQGNRPANPTLDEYIFDGWTTTKDDAATKVDLATQKFTANTTLYALWKSDSIVSAVLLDENELAVASATVTPSTTGDERTLTISGAVPAADGTSGTSYSILYYLASDPETSVDESKITLKLKTADGKVVLDTNTPVSPVEIGDYTYKVEVATDLTAITVAAAAPTIKDVPADAAEDAADQAALEAAKASLVATTDNTMGGLIAEAGANTELKQKLDAQPEAGAGKEYAVAVYLEVTPASYSSAEGEKQLTLEITPKACLVNRDIGGGSEATVAGTEVTLNNFEANEGEEIEITVTLPSNFIVAGDVTNVYVKHGTDFIKPTTCNTTTVVFKASSFSAYQIVVDSRTVTVTINGSGDATFTPDKIGGLIQDPEPTDGEKTFLGWATASDATTATYSGNVLTEDIFNALIKAAEDASEKLTLYPVFSAAPTPGTGGNSKPSQNPDAEETPVELPTQFNDVPAGAYYTDAVIWAIENGITTGTSATTFSPNGDCNRAQMVTFLWRAAGSPKAESSENPFTDLDPSAYYYDAVLWAVEKGITNGTSETTFAPTDIVNRAQTVTFLYRYSNTPEASGNGFTDVVAGSYYESAVDWAVANGITNGTSTTTFSPDATCVRAQTVTFLYRLLVK